jgi:hypothetical protein
LLAAALSALLTTLARLVLATLLLLAGFLLSAAALLSAATLLRVALALLVIALRIVLVVLAWIVRHWDVLQSFRGIWVRALPRPIWATRGDALCSLSDRPNLRQLLEKPAKLLTATAQIEGAAPQ